MSDGARGGNPWILTAFLLGAGAGAVVALLLAPKTGKEAREILAEKLRQAREKP